jgi:hypothetical protein
MSIDIKINIIGLKLEKNVISFEKKKKEREDHAINSS